MQVISTDETIIAYEYRRTIFSNLKLWVNVKCEPWDTNTGLSERAYTKWRKASKIEVLDYLETTLQNTSSNSDYTKCKTCSKECKPIDWK